MGVAMSSRLYAIAWQLIPVDEDGNPTDGPSYGATKISDGMAMRLGGVRDVHEVQKSMSSHIKKLDREGKLWTRKKS